MSIRTERVGEEIRKVVSSRLIRGLKTPLPGFVTINKVSVSPDLKQASIFFSVFGEGSEHSSVLRVLEDEKKFIRKDLASKINLRVVPQLRFCFDPTIEEADRIFRLLNELPKAD